MTIFNIESQQKHEDSDFVQRLPCDACGSRDNAALFSDGHTYCFGCQAYSSGDGNGTSVTPEKQQQHTHHSNLLSGEYVDLRARKLTAETCRKFGYMVATHKGQAVQAASYRDASGAICAQKIRTKDKNFSILGDAKKMTLFGSHLWTSGKKIVLCTGELDCMSISQIQGHKWATCSIPNGDTSARKSVLASYDYLMNFQEIVLLFDQDESGQKAAIEVAEALPVGRVSIGTLPYKDANECLVKGASGEVINAIFQAKAYRPDGILSPDDLREAIHQVDAMAAVHFPYERLNTMCKGVERPALITIAAGSGVGKSTLVREFCYSFMTQGENVGLLLLEETPKRSAQGLVGLHMNKNITIDPDAATPDEIADAYDDLLSKGGKFYLLDHFGSTAMQDISNKITYMHKALGCNIIILDHISLLVSGLTGKVTDERRLVDDIVHHLRTTIVQELGITLFMVSHLKRPNSPQGHEGGAKVRLSELRSSHSIAQLSDFCIGLQVDEDDPTSGIRELVILKNRKTGECGYAGTLQYDRSTSRLIDADTFSAF